MCTVCCRWEILSGQKCGCKHTYVCVGLFPSDFPVLQNKFTALKRQNEKLQMEVMQTRLWQAESVDNELEDEKDGTI